MQKKKPERSTNVLTPVLYHYSNGKFAFIKCRLNNGLHYCESTPFIVSLERQAQTVVTIPVTGRVVVTISNSTVSSIVVPTTAT